MPWKKKYDLDLKLRAIQNYKEGKAPSLITQELGMPKRSVNLIRHWEILYDHFGEDGLEHRSKNPSYAKELKHLVVEEYLRGTGTLTELSIKYGVTSFATIHCWVKRYNSDKELKDYKLKGDITMTPVRKTTIEERIEIARECLDHNKDYRGMAEKYGVTYTQVYQWVKKYLALGESGLVDHRGHKKTESEVSELEKLQRENSQLKYQLEMKERETILLKKVKEIEGRRSLTKKSKKQFM